MITCIVVRSGPGNIRRISCIGHALYDETGKDILCASVTSIMGTTVGAIQELCDAPLNYSFKRGRLEIILEKPHYSDHDVSLIMEACLVGIKQIYLNFRYRKYLELLIIRESNMRGRIIK